MNNKFLTFDNIELYIHEFAEVDSPKGIIQIAHDINESGSDYIKLAESLNKKGFIVFALDQRAHGNNTKNDRALGVYEKDMFYDTVKDHLFLAHTLKNKYKLPLILLGHGFGRFVCERIAQLSDNYDAVVVSGSNLFSGSLKMQLTKWISFLLNYFKNKNDKAIFINTTLQKYNQYKNTNWLTVSKDDKMEAKIFSNQYYYSYVSGVLDVYKSKNTIKMDTKKPMFIFASENDALALNNNELKNVFGFYNEIGMTVVQRVYSVSELNENKPNIDIIKEDIIGFIEKVIGNKNIKSSQKKTITTEDTSTDNGIGSNDDESKDQQHEENQPIPVTKMFVEDTSDKDEYEKEKPGMFKKIKERLNKKK